VSTYRRLPVDWPHRYLVVEAEAGRVDVRAVVCVLTHDPKFDVPVLEVATRLSELAYLGAMGSRRTHDDRLKRLVEAGLTDAGSPGSQAPSVSTLLRVRRRRRR
jgi:xanthine dehydrogenase accessory factor